MSTRMGLREWLLWRWDRWCIAFQSPFDGPSSISGGVLVLIYLVWVIGGSLVVSTWLVLQ